MLRKFMVVLMAGAVGMPARAVDSVSKNTTCLKGDATTPWADGAAPGGSEQIDAFIVDLVNFQTSWGTTFGIAPLIKTSKQSAAFTSSLTSAQAMSRRQLTNVPFAASSYAFWAGPGFGVNNDPTVNDAGTPVNATSLTGNQFSVAVTEFSGSYNGVIGGVVNVQPSEPGRLYVKRVQAANNSCNDVTNLSQFGLGSVDATGTVIFRADGFGTADSCGLTRLGGAVPANDENIFRVSMNDRSASVLNIMSNTLTAGVPGGPFGHDAAAFGGPDWLVRNANAAHNTPGILPAEVTGSNAVLMGSNFLGQYVRGSAFGAIVNDSSHWAAGVTDHRGGVSYTSNNCAALGSTHGIGAVLAKSASGLTDTLNLWGVDPTGAVTGTLALTLPATIQDFVPDPVNKRCSQDPLLSCASDPDCGGSNTCDPVNYNNVLLSQSGDNQFGNYQSQVAFRGGNGQVAMGVDQDGRLVVAATVYHPDEISTDNPFNYVAVARVDCGSSTAEWALAAYNGFSFTGYQADGKPILDGPSGNVIGRVTLLSEVTGGAPLGPSISSPMIDSVGNIYILAAVELFDSVDPEFGPSFPNTALLRAVYNPAAFGYELELLLKLGDVFRGANSDLDYQINFLGIADSNSINSGAPFSQNISEVAHLATDASALVPSDPKTLGGLVLAAEIIYDADPVAGVPTGDGDFDKCSSVFGGLDQDYNVLLYIGSTDAVQSALPPAVPSGMQALHNRQKNRYISFMPNNPGQSVAFRVQKAAIANGAGFCTTSGLACTGAPAQGTCASGQLCVAPYPGGAPAHSCWVQTPVQVGADINTAKCDPTPVFRVWTEPVVHVGDCEIIPASDYTVFTNTAGPIEFPTGLAIKTAEVASFNTKVWADSVGSFNGVEWTPPNRFTNVQDVLGILARISNVAGAPQFTVVNLQATSAPDSCLNAQANTADVLIAVRGVAGDRYGAPDSAKITNTTLCPACP